MKCRHESAFFETLDREILSGMPESDYVECIERLDWLFDSRSKLCPHCGSSEIVMKGHSPRGVQRYACKACGKGFVANVVPHTHLSADKWKLFCRSYMRGMSIHHCAVVCNICLKTSQHMKDRLTEITRSDPSIPAGFRGKLLMDA